MGRITKHNLNDKFSSLLNNPNRYSADKFEVYDTNTGAILSPQEFVSNARTFNVSNDDIINKAQANQYIFRKKDNGTSNQTTNKNSNDDGKSNNQTKKETLTLPYQLSNQLPNQLHQPLPNHLSTPINTSASDTLNKLQQWFQ